MKAKVKATGREGKVVAYENEKTAGRGPTKTLRVHILFPNGEKSVYPPSEIEITDLERNNA